MALHIDQSGHVRRDSVRLVVSDYKVAAQEGNGFWLGVAIGFAAGLVISYVIVSGVITRLFA